MARTENTRSVLHIRVRRGTVFLGVTALASIGLVGAGVLPAYATANYLSGSHFEIDASANLKVNDGGSSIDWNDVDSGAAVTPVSFTADNASGSNDNSFGKGTAENQAVPTVTKGGIPPNKSDLKNFGVYTGEEGFVHLAWSRVQDPSGTTNMDFEFNQSDTLSSNGVTPVRTEGDLLIEYHLANGGASATVSKRTWTGSVWGAEQDLTGNAIGSINTSAILAADSTLGALSARTFGEASIDLSQIFTDTSTCRHFGSAYLKSRSSDSFSSEIKDFIEPMDVDLTNCRSLVVKKVNATGGLLSGASFQLVDGDDVAHAMTESSTAGVFCIDDLDLGDYTLQETVAPTGYTAAEDSTVTIDSSSSQESCTERLADDPVVYDVTITDSPQPGTINLVKKDNASPANAISGASFTVFVDEGTAGTYEELVDTTVYAGPTATASDGTLTFSNVDIGDYCVVETTTPTHYDTADPQCFHVGVATGGDVKNLTFTDPRQHRIVVLVCHEGTDTLDPSDVTMGSTTKTSLGAGSLTAAEQKALCDLGGASFGDLSGHTESSLSVTPN